MIASAGLGKVGAILLRNIPGMETFEPFFVADFETGLQAYSSRIDRAEKIGGRLQASVAVRHGIDPVSGTVLNNGKSVSVMIAMIELVASCKEMNGVAVGLDFSYGHVFNIYSMGVVSAEQH